MKTYIEMIPMNILGAIRQNLGAEDENDTSQDSRIEKFSPQELMVLWCRWHLGHGGWADDIINGYRKLEEIEEVRNLGGGRK